MANFGETPIASVLILIAMEAEAQPLLDKLKLAHVDTRPNFTECIPYEGVYNNCKITLITNGKSKRFGVDNVGTDPATLACYMGIERYNPDIIINAGTAGGFKRAGACIGDAYITTKMHFHDRRIPIPGFTEYGKGDYTSTETTKLVQALGFKSGGVTTSNSLDHTEMDDTLMAENGASVKDMEAAAIAWVAEMAGIPFFALKVVTDIVDGDRPTQDEFFENLGSAAKSLQEKLPVLVDFLVGKKLTEL
jgi:5'-methylthioadenosine nucleosidase